MAKGKNILMKFKKGDFLFGTDELETIIKIKQIDTLGVDLPRAVLINSKYAYWESITGNKKSSFRYFFVLPPFLPPFFPPHLAIVNHLNKDNTIKKITLQNVKLNVII